MAASIAAIGYARTDAPQWFTGSMTRSGPTCGTATLAAGTVTVANANVTSNSVIFLASKTPGGTQGAPYVSSVTPGTGFHITSTSATDTSTVAYMIWEIVT